MTETAEVLEGRNRGGGGGGGNASEGRLVPPPVRVRSVGRERRHPFRRLSLNLSVAKYKKLKREI